MNINITSKDYVEYIELVYKRLLASKDYITELDSELGDGDHWINMDMGFEALVNKKEELSNMKPKDLLKNIGMIMMSVIGGSSGVLYGSAYIKAAKNISDVETLNLNSIYEILNSELLGMMERGKAEAGDKTMIDPLFTAVNSFKKSLESNKNILEILESVRLSAKQGMEDTREMSAKKGRARYREDKGIGHIDPGAVTMYYQIDELMKYISVKIK
ncbi:MAG: dihydroxyacetone kinase subunit DhaL [Fusobacteriaceae bacterium]